jgi:hypothetical protein
LTEIAFGHAALLAVTIFDRVHGEAFDGEEWSSQSAVAYSVTPK